MMRSLLHALAAAALVASSAAALAEPAVTVKAVDLKQTPATDARSVASLAADTPIDTVKREGAWVQVRTARATGWVKLFDIRMAASGDTAPRKSAGGGSIAETLNLAAGNRATTATTGVRGLDEDMLRRASPNAQEVNTLAGYATSKGDAQAFARAGRLEPRAIDSLTAAPPAAIGGAKK